MQERLILELKRKYPEYVTQNNLMFAMQDVYAFTQHPFIILIDEWDCLFREYQHDQNAQKKYLDFLRSWLKDKEYVALAYMTGILPIKKYGSHSALNMFTEYSMTDPGDLAEYFGFTEDEVKKLCAEYQMNYEETKAWYDGYHLRVHQRTEVCDYAMYNPKSVVEAMMRHKYGTYWNRTETYEALKVYIQMNMDGLKDAVIEMLGGESVRVNTGTFMNDMTTFATRDDVLTLLVHLGYLTYDFDTCTVHIPNQEVQKEFINCIEDGGWEPVMDAIRKSEELLAATIRGEEETVARMIENAHQENTSILAYNDENSLACVIALAYYSAKKNYVVYRELAGGKGFADMVFVPRKTTQTPAIVVELKWNQTAEAAITQIKRKQYVESLKDYRGEVILVGINYESKELKKDDYKKHSCKIERITMA